MVKRLHSFWLNLSIGRKGIAIIAIPAISLITVVIWFAGLQKNMESAHSRVLHTERVRLEAGRLLGALLEAEGGMRLYAIARRADLLKTYSQAVSTVPDSLARVTVLVQDNPLQAQRFEAIKTLLQW